MFDEDAWEAFFFNEQTKLGSKYNLLDTPPHTEIQTDCLKVCTISHYLLDAVVCKWLS